MCGISRNVSGFDVIRSFRKQYAGSYYNAFVQKVRPLEARYLSVASLPDYRSTGEKLFPSANWDLGISRYKQNLMLFRNGILTLVIGNEILGYLSLWPVTKNFRDGFMSGENSDDEFFPDKLFASEPQMAPAWYLTAVAILPQDKRLRSQIRNRLINEIASKFADNPQTEIFAEAETDSGNRFLRRLGFLFPVLNKPKLCVLSREVFKK